MKKKKASNEFKEATNEEKEFVHNSLRLPFFCLPFFCLKKNKTLDRNRVMRNVYCVDFGG